MKCPICHTNHSHDSECPPAALAATMPASKLERQENSADLVSRLEAYLSQYVTFKEPGQAFAIALWIISTHTYMHFDAFPYMVVTSPTKQSGKTRTMELISFTCANPKPLAAMTAATIFRTVTGGDFPVILFDEAETLSSEGASDIRAVLNVGYRKGQKIPRVLNNEVVEFDTYCPKVFILIGDPYDTLRDRSIIITMRRAEPKRRFLYSTAQTEGSLLAEEIKRAFGKYETPDGVKYHDTPIMDSIKLGYADFQGLPFLRDRDEEIWTPLFIVCNALCPERLSELTRIAVDMSADKTSEARRYTSSASEEREMEESQYSVQLLGDMLKVMEQASKTPIVGKDYSKARGNKITVALSLSQCVAKLKEIPSAPWRKYKGIGLDERTLTHLLRRFKGVNQRAVRIDRNTVVKGYDYETIQRAKEHLPK